MEIRKEGWMLESLDGWRRGGRKGRKRGTEGKRGKKGRVGGEVEGEGGARIDKIQAGSLPQRAFRITKKKKSWKWKPIASEITDDEEKRGYGKGNAGR